MCGISVSEEKKKCAKSRSKKAGILVYERREQA